MPYEIVLDSFQVDAAVSRFAAFFSVPVTDDGAGKKIVIPRVFGKGVIRVVDFSDGVSVLMYDCLLKQDMKIRYRVTDVQPLRLIFCVKGDLRHLIKADRMQYQLSNFFGSMVSGTRHHEQEFMIPGNREVNYYVIGIDRKRYVKKNSSTLAALPADLREVFTDTESTHPFLYQVHYSQTIAQCIQNINATHYRGLVRRVYLESQIHEMLALQVKQYADDLSPGARRKLQGKRDTERIIEARNRLLANLMDPPKLRELAKLSGTKENKLKRGFHVLYSTSVNKLLQNERLSRAKLLIAEQNYPIKEIARMVGYNHSGHFTAKFKKRFGCLPKDYIKSMII
jgi:AraC family transcriptional regulator, transcriptional activator of the genes for pyochelin and ferripyochelin receptors